MVVVVVVEKEEMEMEVVVVVIAMKAIFVIYISSVVVLRTSEPSLNIMTKCGDSICTLRNGCYWTLCHHPLPLLVMVIVVVGVGGVVVVVEVVELFDHHLQYH